MSLFKDPKPLVFVVGNIGSSKSTTTEALAKLYSERGEDVKVLREPAAAEDGVINPWLDLYYEDPKRWAFHMQMFLLPYRYRMHKRGQALAMEGDTVVIGDSCYWNDYLVFAKQQIEDGFFDENEMEVYKQHHKDMAENLYYPTAIVYITSPVWLCEKRIARRMEQKEGRACECNIKHEYLAGLSNKISKLVDNLGKFTTIIRVDPLDVNGREKTPEMVAKEALEGIDNVLKDRDSIRDECYKRVI